jgi:hypothetical protein
MPNNFSQVKTNLESPNKLIASFSKDKSRCIFAEDQDKVVTLSEFEDENR